MDKAGRHDALRRGKEALTTPWRSAQDAENADETNGVASVAMPLAGGRVSKKQKNWLGACHPAIRGEMAQNAASRFSSIRRASRFGGWLAAFVGRVVEGATGVVIASALLLYLLSRKVRAVFGSETVSNA